MQLFIQRAGPLTEQNGKPVARLLLRRLERRDRSLGGFEARTTALHIEFRAATYLIEQLGELERLLFALQVLARHRESLLRAA